MANIQRKRVNRNRLHMFKRFARVKFPVTCHGGFDLDQAIEHRSLKRSQASNFIIAQWQIV